MRLLAFGSRGWRDLAACGSVLDELRPAVVIEGEADGADTLFRSAAEARGIRVLPFAIDRVLDGPNPRQRPKNRNARQLREGRPNVGACCVVGKLGSPLTPGSRDMMERLLGARVRVLVVREDGRRWVDP